MQTISKLHQQAPERAPVKTANLADLRPEAAPTLLELAERSWAQPLHRRFLSPRRSRNDSPAPWRTACCRAFRRDRSDAFARLAARDHAAHAVRAKLLGRWQAQQARHGGRRSSAAADGDSNLIRSSLGIAGALGEAELSLGAPVFSR